MSDESIRQHIMTNTASAAPAGRRLVEVEEAEALRLLASVGYGRVVFTLDALPAIRPVNHVVHDGEIIIRTRLTAKVTTTIKPLRDTVVAYQADLIDPQLRLGWSVVVTGYARPVTDPADVAHYEQILTPWVDMTMDMILRIHPEIVTGFRLIEAETPAPTTP